MEYIILYLKILILMIYMFSRYIQNWFGKIFSILDIVNKSSTVVYIHNSYLICQQNVSYCMIYFHKEQSQYIGFGLYHHYAI